jgi:hypothetical protein
MHTRRRSAVTGVSAGYASNFLAPTEHVAGECNLAKVVHLPVLHNVLWSFLGKILWSPASIVKAISKPLPQNISHVPGHKFFDRMTALYTDKYTSHAYCQLHILKLQYRR